MQIVWQSQQKVALGRATLRKPSEEPPSETLVENHPQKAWGKPPRTPQGEPPSEVLRKTTLRIRWGEIAKPLGEPPLENPRWGHPQKTRPAIPTYHRPRPQRQRRTCRKRPPTPPAHTPQLCRKRKAQAKGHPNHPEPPSSTEPKGNCRRPWLLQFRQ